MEASGLTGERRVFLSTLPAERGERRLALAVVLASAAVFLAAAPFAKLPLAQIGAFIPIYESALVINDLITAVLLFGQFCILRSPPLRVPPCGYPPAMIFVVSSVWVLTLVALAVLWRRRPHSVLDLWLMVVMCAWIFDIALSAVLNAGRFDLGFYAGRIYGLLAASFVLIVLLLENSVLYARLVETHESERRKTAELLAANRDLDAFSHSVAHDLRSPLRAVRSEE